MSNINNSGNTDSSLSLSSSSSSLPFDLSNVDDASTYPQQQYSPDILSGKPVAALIKTTVKNEISYYTDRNLRAPKLVIIKTSDDQASASYIKGKIKDCEECGIICDVKDLTKSSEEDFIQTVKYVNSPYTTDIDGVIVQLPLREDLKHLTRGMITNWINPSKDVDCFTPVNLYKLSSGKYYFAPCTPAGIIEILKYYNIPIAGKNVVIIGRSDIVGKPLATMMTNENATVTLCHSKTKNIKYYTMHADIIVSAVGKEKFVTKQMITPFSREYAQIRVKPYQTIIDVGINRNSEGKICGDVDFENVKDFVKAITPVPGGVGLMTRAMLMKNVLTAYKLHNNL